jgi:hypothetical protein
VMWGVGLDERLVARSCVLVTCVCLRPVSW